MGSRSKKSKRSKISRVRVDRMSDLPDSLLIKILSLLPVESAVRTSVLSKRWRPLCYSLSNLRFDDSNGKKSSLHLINSVDTFLMHRPVHLSVEEFALKCNGDYDPTRVNHWIRKALDHHLKCISLSLCFRFRRGLYQLLPDIYTYGNLQVLRLGRRILVHVPKTFSFSSLKVLQFHQVTFSSCESVEGLLLNCPVLEDLFIKNCSWLSGINLTVCGSALKNLTLQCVDEETPLNILIDTPSLETLEIEDSTYANIFIKDTLLSLRTAHIDLGMEGMELNDSVFGILEKIYHVKFLTLNDKAVGALDRACDKDYHLPTFHNLTTLELEVDNWSCWNLLPDILLSSPKLQNLLLPYGVDLTHDSEGCDYGWWNRPKLVPECLLSHLKTVEIEAFHGTEDELTLFEYLLAYGRALRKISICCSERERKSRIRKKLVSCSRGSKTCKILIS